MGETRFEGRRAVSVENEVLRVTVLCEGGHLAEVFDKRAGVSPLWVPQWDSVEPSVYDARVQTEYGETEGGLLSGIMGHNLCLDLFGGPSAAEAALGLTAHGEGSTAPYVVTSDGAEIRMRAHLPLAQMEFERTLRLVGGRVEVREVLQSLSAIERGIGWTEHVTLGPPFLDPATTEFRASMRESMVFDEEFGVDAYLERGAEFVWPMAPGKDGRGVDLRRMRAAPASGYTAHVADRGREDAFFVAFSAAYGLAFGYVWKTAEFPWMGIWEENRSRQASPWGGREVARGMEFGVSPFPETRRRMVERERVFGAPMFQWMGARERVEKRYWIVSEPADRVPEEMGWPG